jgi:hypothetical protein
VPVRACARGLKGSRRLLGRQNEIKKIEQHPIPRNLPNFMDHIYPYRSKEIPASFEV